MPAKTSAKKKPTSKSKAMPAMKKKPAMAASKTSTMRKTPEPFYTDPVNLMVIGAVVVLFLGIVMLVSSGMLM